MKFAAAIVVVAYAVQISAFAPATNQRQPTALQMSGVLGKTTGKSALDPAVIARYRDLAFPPDKLLAEYVWVDADGNTRSKTRTLPASKVSIPANTFQMMMKPLLDSILTLESSAFLSSAGG